MNLKLLDVDDCDVFVCWMVWKSAEDGGRPYLVAVDTSERRAERHKECAIMEARTLGKTVRVLVEKSCLNHLYGETMGQGLDSLRELFQSSRRDRTGD